MAQPRKTERLAHGQLPAAKTTLYTCRPGTKVIVTSISLVNTDTSARTANLYLKENGGTSRRIIANDMSIDIAYLWTEKELSYAMHAGDVIEGDASVASKIDYVLSGEVY